MFYIKCFFFSIYLISKSESIKQQLFSNNTDQSKDNSSTKITTTDESENKNIKIKSETHPVLISFDDTVEILWDQNSTYVPLEVKTIGSTNFSFKGDCQYITVDIEAPYIRELLQEGAKLVDDSSALYDYSHEVFSSLNWDAYSYEQKMDNAVANNIPIPLSELAQNSVGACLEQSIFRTLVYAYSSKNTKLLIFTPEEDSDDYGHATVSASDAEEEDVIGNFLATELYTWEINYIEIITIEID